MRKIHIGNVRDILPSLPSNSFHGCLTDPPYELGFLGKSWDSTGIAFSVDLWSEVLRVMTPGSYLLACGGTRTYHRMTCAIEDAGFEIRDCLQWLYATGFPKSKACLKPSWEPIVLARKPGKTMLPLNVDGCRIGFDSGGWKGNANEGSYGGFKSNALKPSFHRANDSIGTFKTKERVSVPSPLGRWPANTILDEFFASESWSRYFYTAKASRKERDAGLDQFPLTARETMGSGIGGQPDQTRPNNRNFHPTVKPLSLTTHLAKLILPQPSPDTQRRLLVPFSGSGSEMIGGLKAGWDDVTGVELSGEYAAIAEARIRHWDI